MAKPDYSGDYKYDSSDVAKFERNKRVEIGGKLTSQVDPNQNMFKYFYPNRDAIEKRFERERLRAEAELAEKAKVDIDQILEKETVKSTKSSGDLFLRQKWQNMRMTKELCDDHQQPVTKFSYPFIQFLCHD